MATSTASSSVESNNSALATYACLDALHVTMFLERNKQDQMIKSYIPDIKQHALMTDIVTLCYNRQYDNALFLLLESISDNNVVRNEEKTVFRVLYCALVRLFKPDFKSLEERLLLLEQLLDNKCFTTTATRMLLEAEYLSTSFDTLGIFSNPTFELNQIPDATRQRFLGCGRHLCHALLTHQEEQTKPCVIHFMFIRIICAAAQIRLTMPQDSKQIDVMANYGRIFEQHMKNTAAATHPATRAESVWIAALFLSCLFCANLKQQGLTELVAHILPKPYGQDTALVLHGARMFVNNPGQLDEKLQLLHHISSAIAPPHPGALIEVACMLAVQILPEPWTAIRTHILQTWRQDDPFLLDWYVWCLFQSRDERRLSELFERTYDARPLLALHVMQVDLSELLRSSDEKPIVAVSASIQSCLQAILPTAVSFVGREEKSQFELAFSKDNTSNLRMEFCRCHP